MGGCGWGCGSSSRAVVVPVVMEALGGEEGIPASLPVLGRRSPLPAALRLPRENYEAPSGVLDSGSVQFFSLKMDCPLEQEQGLAALAAPGGAGDAVPCGRAGPQGASGASSLRI